MRAHGSVAPQTVLMGLCSGAVDALRIAANRETVTGLVLLDGFVPRDLSWYAHRVALRAGRRWQRFTAAVRGAEAPVVGLPSAPAEAAVLGDDRDWRDDDLHRAYAEVLGRDVPVLAVFSGSFAPYNHHGQLTNALRSGCAIDRLTEVYFPEADHTYMVVHHRERLLRRVLEWTERNYAQDTRP